MSFTRLQHTTLQHSAGKERESRHGRLSYFKDTTWMDQTLRIKRWPRAPATLNNKTTSMCGETWRRKRWKKKKTFQPTANDKKKREKTSWWEEKTALQTVTWPWAAHTRSIHPPCLRYIQPPESFSSRDSFCARRWRNLEHFFFPFKMTTNLHLPYFLTKFFPPLCKRKIRTPQIQMTHRGSG